MDQYIGLDVSLKDTAISIREDGKRIWRGKCPSDPKLLAQMIRKHAPRAKRVVFETGPLSTWLYHVLTNEGIPAICIEARHAQKVLNDDTLKGTIFDGGNPPLHAGPQAMTDGQTAPVF